MTLRPSDADRARGALLGTFVGDALGMPFEGCAPETPPEPLGAAMRVSPVAVLFRGELRACARRPRAARASPTPPARGRRRGGPSGGRGRCARRCGPSRRGAQVRRHRAAPRPSRPCAHPPRPQPRPTPGAWRTRLGTARRATTALYAATQGQDFEQAVSFAVACGGDVDTIGAMTGAVAGARLGAGAIPVRWLKALEDGERGRTHVERLAERLHCSGFGS